MTTRAPARKTPVREDEARLAATLATRLQRARSLGERETRALASLSRAAVRAGATGIDATLTPRGLFVSLEPVAATGPATLTLSDNLAAQLRGAFEAPFVRVDFAERPQFSQPDARAPAQREAVALARDWLARVVAMEGECLAREGEARNEKGVHELRIAIRRCRTALRWLARSTRDPRLEEVVSVLRTLGAAAGPLRDADVILALLKKRAPKGAARDAAMASVREARVAREAAFDRHLRARTHRASMRRADAALAAMAMPATTPSAGALSSPEQSEERAGRSLQRFFDRELRRIHERLEGDLTVDEGYHDVRRQLRRVRDIIDLCGPALGARRLRWRGRLQPIQSLLGSFNDVASARLLIEPVGESTRDVVQWLKTRRAATLTELATPLAVLAALVIAR
ncbi:MAG: CHAD domain-containing protein [Myxococcales bacterium]|nr:CHAD domain-containing protein [Myxococcales bacterium]